MKQLRSIDNGRFIVDASAKKKIYPTGAMKDVDNDKPRYELIPVLPLKRVAMLYAAGAKKYSDDNWAKGLPYRRVYASMLRHAFAFAEGCKKEDHLAAVVFNAFCLMYYQDKKMDRLDNMPK